MADKQGDKIRLGIIFGGQSSEHEVSRISAESVLKHINAEKYDLKVIGITREGKWLAFDGDPKLIGNGGWEKVAEEQASRRRIASNNANGPALQDKQQAEFGGTNETGNKTVYTAIAVNTARNILKNAGAETDILQLDVVFPVMHGVNGEDGAVQGLLELAGLPYVGSGVLGSALGMDKAYAKMLFERAGLPQGKFLVFSRKQVESDIGRVADAIEVEFGYPNFIKPSNTGSSVGVSKAHGRAELENALRYAARFDRKILAEEFIKGMEIECAILGNDDPIASTIGEIIPCNEFYDYAAKYSSESTSECIIPANLPPVVIDRVRDLAVKAFKTLDCAGMARVDFFVAESSEDPESPKGSEGPEGPESKYRIMLNELNTIPGFTSISMYPKLWAASGISYPELIDRLIALAIERCDDNRRDYGFEG